MNDDDLLALIAQEERQAVGYHYGELSNEREAAMNYYMGRPFGNEEDGKSQIISTDVRDAIEGTLPSLLDMFTSSKEAVEFEPVGVEDEEQAKAATALCNYVFYKQNNGFLILYQWFKDALLQKNGVVKFWYEDTTKKTKETYENLNELELYQLLQNPNVAVTGTSEREDGSLEIEIEVTDRSGKVCIQNVPPEEFMITQKHNSVSLQDCLFLAHRMRKTVSELKEMGYDVSDNAGDDDGVEFSAEYLARRQFAEETLETDPSDKSLRRVWVTECYLRVDFDGDGIAELRRVLRCGNEILENEETDYIPFAAITPIIMPHRFYGLSEADLLMDIQFHKSVLWRQMMDNLYLTNNPQKYVLENQVNLDDLLVSRVGGIVRIRVPGAVTPAETPFVAGQSFPMLEYLDQVKENRSGVTRYNQGSDADSLNKTATGISRIMNASEQRIKLFARIFAETGVKDLFRGILHCLQKYSTAPMQLRLLGRVVEMDPRQWKTQWDVTVNVGLGTGDKSEQVMQLQTIAAIQKELKMAGIPWVTDDNLYNMARKISEASGFPHEGMFFTPPKNVPPTPPQPSPEMLKIEAEKEIAGQEMQHKQASAELSAEMQKYVADLQAKTQIVIAQMMEQNKRELAQLQSQDKKEIEQFKAGHDAEKTVFQASHDAEKTKFQASAKQAESPGGAASPAKPITQDSNKQIAQALKALADSNTRLHMALTSPKKIVRDAEGNATIETVQE